MIIVIASLLFSSALLAAETPGAYTYEIAPNVYSFGSGGGYHSMFAISSKGVAVFESVNTKHAQALLKAIKEKTDKPVKYLFLTHNHWDHSSGGKVFQDEGAKVIMHKLAGEYLKANPGQDTTLPDRVWKGKQKDIKMGDITVEMHYLGLNHGLGMTVYVIPEKRISYIADLVSPNRVMFTIVPDFNIGGWEKSLAKILELDFDKAVCTHNELSNPQKGCDKTHVKEILEFIQGLRGAIFAEFKKGTPPQQIPSVVRLPKYSHLKYYDDWLKMNAWRILLDSFMGPYPWVAGAEK